MALQTLGNFLVWPGIQIPSFGGGINTTANLATLDAAGEYMAFVLCAQEDMVVSHVGWKNASPTGSPTADVRIETVGTDGMPSGTLWGTNTNIVTGALSAGWTLSALTASATIPRGSVYCVKIAYNSGTSFIVNGFTNLGPNVSALPYKVTNTGTPTKTLMGNTGILALGSNSTTFYNLFGFLPASGGGSSTLNNTGGARRGLRFKVTFPCRAVGLLHYPGTNVGDYTYGIQNDAGTVLSSSDTTIEGDQSGANANGITYCFFDNTVTLAAGTWYRAYIEPTSATNTNYNTVTMPSADYISATPFKANAHYATYTSGGGWVDTTTEQILLLDILIDQLDDGVSAGGLIRPNGLNGGFV